MRPARLTKQVAAPHRQHIVAERERRRELILSKADEILERYVHGESIKAIVDSMNLGISSHEARLVLMKADETYERYANANEMRSHYLVEAAVEFGMQAAAIGDAAGLRVGVDTALKVAGKLNQAQYGDANRVELTGKGGGAMQIKADLTLTAEQAYERLIKGD